MEEGRSHLHALQLEAEGEGPDHGQDAPILGHLMAMDRDSDSNH